MGIKRKIIVILGPTSSGKSSLAVKLAKKFCGEIISADSRQVYKGMDIGSGKITKDEMMGIPHYLLDIASPKRNFSVGRYQRMTEKAILDITKRGKVPILCGGTAFYLKVITEGIILPKTKPDWKLRKELEKKDVKELYQILKKLDPRRAGSIEKDNPRRLIRAIEIVTKSKKAVPVIKKESRFVSLKLGIETEQEKLNRAIKKRLIKRLEKGMIEETKRLKESGISWKRLDDFGLEYRWIARYLQKKIPYNQMVESLYKDIVKFSKKQMAWFKKDDEIEWIKRYREAVPLVKHFLQK